jgi:hypothetical protein
VGLGAKLKHAWNAFSVEEPDRYATAAFPGGGDFVIGNSRPDRIRITTNDRSMIGAIYTRMATDFSAISIRHVRLDDNDRFTEEVKSGLNNCLKLEANIDQGARAFKQDIALTMFEHGYLAVVPVDTSVDPGITAGFDVLTMRVGHIVKWYPQHVRVSVYNEKTGKRQEVTVHKTKCAVIENPFYNVMNETNSTLQRLHRKLSLLDSVEEAAGSGKLDLIIQLPYVVKSEARKAQAEQRRNEIEVQLKGSKYGIAYTDGTEKVTQLNRPAENNLLGTIEYLTKELYGQLGLTPEIMNGTADEKTMLNYYTRTIEPLLEAVVEGMKRVFLTKTARSQGQSIEYFRDPFKLLPISNIADIGDKLLRNEVLTSNEMRQVLGFKPSKDPKADQLINSNMPQSDTGLPVANADDPAAVDPAADPSVAGDDAESIMNSALDEVDASLDGMFQTLGIEG